MIGEAGPLSDAQVEAFVIEFEEKTDAEYDCPDECVCVAVCDLRLKDMGGIIQRIAAEAAKAATERATWIVREHCQACDGTGGKRTSRTAHGCGGNESVCDVRCPVEIEDFEECQYCGEPIAAIRASITGPGVGKGEK